MVDHDAAPVARMADFCGNDLGMDATDGITLARLPVPPEQGDGYCEMAWLAPDLFVFIADATLRTHLAETVDGDGWGAFHLRLRGRSTDRIGANAEVVRQPGTFSTTVYPFAVPRTETHVANDRFSSVAVAFRPSALERLALLDEARDVAALRSFIGGQPAEYFYGALPLDAAMATLARDVLSSGLTRRLRQVYIEAKAMELICLSLQRLASGKPAPSQVRLGATDRERLHAVRKHLDAARENVPSLAALSRMFSLNRNKLVYGFKALFGQGVFEYSRQRRLDYARGLLLETSLPTIEIAARAGYENPSSFTRAYQRQFGHAPRRTRAGGREVTDCTN